MQKVMQIPLFNETIFIFPFSYDGGLKKWERHFQKEELECYWTKGEDIYSKYFLRHILNRENKPLYYKYVPGSMKWNYTDEVRVLSKLTKDGTDEEYFINLIGLSLFVFPTGIGFVVMRIKYNENESVREIANLSAAFSRIFANEKDLVNSRVRCYVGEERLSLIHLLQDSIGDLAWNKVEFFPCTHTKRAFVFHRLVTTVSNENEKLALRRNLWVSEEMEKNFVGQTDLEEELAISEARICLMSPMVMCVISDKVKGTDEELARRENNVRFSYFDMFLLAIHEQQALMLYDHERVLIGKKLGHSKKLKKELLRFLPSYSFKVISLEITYQQLYLSLQKILHLEALEERLKNNIEMLETAYIQRRDTVLNMILFVLSVMGVFSLIADIITVVSKITGA